jgi:alkanesulfonate monooxygenase SsuD/methylene tetrahydromethanopterin reductase-like flavin-dependent oxidoreductase (luciferase family)
LAIAQRADEVGLDVFAIGEHHNPPFFSSSPTTLLAHIAARTRQIVLSRGHQAGPAPMSPRVGH